MITLADEELKREGEISDKTSMYVYFDVWLIDSKDGVTMPKKTICIEYRKICLQRCGHTERVLGVRVVAKDGNQDRCGSMTTSFGFHSPMDDWGKQEVENVITESSRLMIERIGRDPITWLLDWSQPREKLLELG